MFLGSVCTLRKVYIVQPFAFTKGPPPPPIFSCKNTHEGTILFWSTSVDTIYLEPQLNGIQCSNKRRSVSTTTHPLLAVRRMYAHLMRFSHFWLLPCAGVAPEANTRFLIRSCCPRAPMLNGCLAGGKKTQSGLWRVAFFAPDGRRPTA